MLEDDEIDTKCLGHNNYQLLHIECIAKPANYLESKDVPEIWIMWVKQRENIYATTKICSCNRFLVQLKEVNLHVW